VHVTTVPITLAFLHGQAAFMRSHGIATEAISSPGEGLDEFAASEGVPVHPVVMARRISPAADAIALSQLVRTLRRLRPQIVHAHTPKAGLLGTMASRLAGVPVTIYHLHGLPLETARGLKRGILRWSDRTACRLADRVLCVGPSVRESALAYGLCPAERMKVLLRGSINGVDAAGRFDPDRLAAGTREEVRREMGIPVDALVLGFMGRIAADKGIRELVEAWNLLSRRHPGLHLLLVGPAEVGDAVSRSALDSTDADSRVHRAGLRWDTPRWYAAMDVVALPTYREGLPVVPLEAAAMRLPVVATSIPACADAVVDGETGSLVPPRDGRALADALDRYLRNPDLRGSHGREARDRMLRWFRPEAMWEALLGEYQSLLRWRGIAP
jgi:glycosyltransferase involved in cell wall biosynthesis